MIYPDLIRIAPGSNAQASYQAFPIAPYYEGLAYPREIYGASVVYEDGLPLATLRFRAPDAAVLLLILARAGVSSAKVASVTIRLPDESRLGYADWNGQAVRPALEGRRWNLLRYGDVELVIRKLKGVT